MLTIDISKRYFSRHFVQWKATRLFTLVFPWFYKKCHKGLSQFAKRNSEIVEAKEK